jgi:GntR family transcriptional repressor for pyruvate dehydrogenase complex
VRNREALKAMAAAIAEQRAGSDRGFAANRSFHLALVHSAGNPHLDRFAESLWVQAVGTVIFDAQTADAEAARHYAEPHQAILDAITAGDAELAERLTREHILASPVPA